MTSNPVAWPLADLGITKSHSRPHTSNQYGARQRVRAIAYAAHPERFVRQSPIPPPLPTAA